MVCPAGEGASDTIVGPAVIGVTAEIIAQDWSSAGDGGGGGIGRLLRGRCCAWRGGRCFTDAGGIRRSQARGGGTGICLATGQMQEDVKAGSEHDKDE